MQQLRQAPAAAAPWTFAKTFNTMSGRMKDTQDACCPSFRPVPRLPPQPATREHAMLVLYDVLWIDNIAGGA
jgi:hypothetical protein